MRIPVTLFLILVGAAPTLAQDTNQQICSTYAHVALPPEAQRVTAPAKFPGCESYKSLAGIGRPINYQAARACAWQERAAQQESLPQNPAAGTAWVVGGDAILVGLYANGLGTPKNLPLALHLACEQGSGLAADSVNDLDKRLHAAAPAAKPFEVCGNAMTTLTENFCEEFQSEVDASRRERALRKLSSSWTPEQKAAFTKVKSAEKMYVETHAKELDQGGTIHAIRDMESEEIMHHNFLLDLQQFERGHTPQGTTEAARAAEEQMSDQYQQNLAAARANPILPNQPLEKVTAENITQVQAAWETYCKAWIVFAALRYPAVPKTAFKAYFADQRLQLLKAMRDQIYSD